MKPEGTCPDCGATLPADAPRGLCPNCLMGAALPSTSPPSSAATGTVEPAGPRVLDTIAQSAGPVPRVLLRDTAPGETPGPVVRPDATDADPSIRYRIDGEIARGGMGAILKGRDPDLGRDVAIKVLRLDLRDNGDLVRRFVEEAQIGGQLQHPGVVPIYELGTFADRRPFFSMKLVKGQTLADLLAARSGPADDLPRFLSIFAAIAQTMAYSHTRGVIHRDLKPSNVMVGSFGEVQVMDWGLAKVLPRGGVAADARAGKEAPPETLIATARSGSDADLSHAGSVLGTPSYMSPEQARGEIDLVDERSDVFALGSVLCEILSGSPAFTGRSSAEILRKASRGDTAEALSRLDGSGAEGELIALAKACLASEPEDRPRDAHVVSDRITAYLSGVQERVQAAERERAVAVARAVEERRRRKVQLALAASVLAFTTLSGLSTTYYLQQRAERERKRLEQAAASDRVVGQAETLLNQAKGNPDDISRWQVALAAVKQAEAADDEGAQPRLLAMQAEIQAGLDAARRDRALLDHLVDIRSAEADDPDGSITEAAYANAFHEAGIDVASRPPAEAGAEIKARPASVISGLVGALDDWAAVRQQKLADASGAAKLREAARIADPDPWRDKLRNALDLTDKSARRTALLVLAKEASYDELGPISLQMLGTGLDEASDSPQDDSVAQAEAVLRKAQQRHPHDVWVNYTLARVLERLSRRDEAIRFYTAARAIRPETAHELAHALQKRSESDEAIAVFRNLKELRPSNARHLGCLGNALRATGHSQEGGEMLDAAVAAGREAIRLKPDSSYAHSSFGFVLNSQGKHDEAIAEYREAIRLKPDDAHSYHQLGHALRDQGKSDEAAAEWRESIRLNPGVAEVHKDLGALLIDFKRDYPSAETELREAIRLNPDDAAANSHLGLALSKQGKHDEAIALFRNLKELHRGNSSDLEHLAEALEAKGLLREADETFAAAVDLSREEVRHKPDDYQAHINLGHALQSQGKMFEGGAEYGEAQKLDPKHPPQLMDMERVSAIWRRAARLNPDDARAHYELGSHLMNPGKPDEAIAELKEAIRLFPDYGEAHARLGDLLARQNKHDEAIAELRAATRLQPDNAYAHSILANLLANQGKQEEAAAENREVLRINELNPGPLWTIHSRAHQLAGSKPSEAEPLFREALAGYRKAQGPAGALTIDLTRDLAEVLEKTGRSSEVEPLLRDAMEGARKQFGADDPRTAGVMGSFGLFLSQQGKWDAAEPLLREALAIRGRIQPDEWTTFDTRSMYGGILLGQKKYDEAEPLIVSGYEGIRIREAKIHPNEKWRLKDAADRVVKLYEEWGKKEKAASWRAKLAKPSDGARSQP